MKISDRIRCPRTGKIGKLVFISPETGRYYLEFDRKFPWIIYAPWQLKQGGDLFAPL